MNSYFPTENTNRTTNHTDDTESDIHHLDISLSSKIHSMPFRDLGSEENGKKINFFLLNQFFTSNNSNNQGCPIYILN